MLDEEASNDHNNKHSTRLEPLQQSSSSATRRAGQFRCVGAIRKAGFVSVKKWILKRRQSIELARKQGWKRYWVCLRGTALLFYSLVETANQPDDDRIDLLSWLKLNCASQWTQLAVSMQSEQTATSQEQLMSSMSKCYIEKEPRHLIIIEGAIGQPIPEHPKRDFVFCLSTSFGDAYLFQAGCQLEADNWISAIHNACSASIARDLTRDEASKLFETKIRYLELEAEKKLFLRQRLDSRLTSMSSITHINATTTNNSLVNSGDSNDSKITMRILLQRLSQQLVAIDAYIEQLHCEIYQLRCYLPSCGNRQPSSEEPQVFQQPSRALDLPHPKSLLMFVSKPTKLLLIKLGVFTVSSFHAYIHARQGSAESILQKMHSSQSSKLDSPLELRVRSNSISDNLLSSREKNSQLEADAEQLIHLSNLKAIPVHINKSLFARLRAFGLNQEQQQVLVAANDSDDRYSFHEAGNYVIIKLKVHSSAKSMSIIKLLLQIINAELDELSFLNFYLCINGSDEEHKSSTNYVIKRRETPSDWQKVDHLELVEKCVFKLELTRNQLDEDASPFGISLAAQLLLTSNDNPMLDVYCSYVEWGTVADKAGLRDEDEILVINGAPVMDLDMMFIESIVQNEKQLKLIVRSSRQDHPANSTLLDSNSFEPKYRDGENHFNKYPSANPTNQLTTSTASQVISDEYLSTLICPPPPSHQNAFLRTDSNLLIRQKSDMATRSFRQLECKLLDEPSESAKKSLMSKAKSDQNLNQWKLNTCTAQSLDPSRVATPNESTVDLIGSELAQQLLSKTLKLTELIDNNPTDSWIDMIANETAECKLAKNSNSSSVNSSKSDLNSVERLRKSILELLETEYAYIRHLETIDEHYMQPLESMNYLNIADLKRLNRVIVELTEVQRCFFDRLMSAICTSCLTQQDCSVGDESEQMNRILQLLDSFQTVEAFEPIVQSISKTFLDEADKFKIYSAYCATYSRLQKLLHPKPAENAQPSPIVSLPTALDTFISSGSFGTSRSSLNTNNPNQQRDFFKPLGYLMNSSSSDLGSQIRQLSEFLANLDSSSSSASLSLARSGLNSDQSSKQQAKLKSSSSSASSSASQQASNNQTSNAHQQNFESYLIKPIQRIVKYPMLLSSIALTTQLNSAELQSTVSHMESITSHVNDTQRIYDEFGFIFDHIEQQYLRQQVKSKPASPPPGAHQPPIELNIEQLLHFGPVDWLNITEFNPKLKKGVELSQLLFVFSSCVVFICLEQIRPISNKRKLPLSTVGLTSQTSRAQAAKASIMIRYQSLIPVSEVQVRSLPGSGMESNSDYRWELFRCSSIISNSNLLSKSDQKRNTSGKVYLLACADNEARNAFLRKIRFIIRESVRNMSLPLARSPSYKSITPPKKLSNPPSGNNTNSSCSNSISTSTVCNSGCRDDDTDTKFSVPVDTSNNYTSSNVIQVNN